MKRLIIIGGGASGLACAVEALKRGLKVILLEKKEVPGKKLSITGNGKCNLTNLSMSEENYVTEDPGFLRRFLKSFSPENAIGFFLDLGLLTSEKNGYVYPVTGQASSVVHVLLRACKSYKELFEPHYSCNVTKVIKEKDGLFSVYSETEAFKADAVCFSAGTEAGVRDREKYTAENILKGLGHRFYPYVPSLLPLIGNTGFEKMFSGVRVKGSVTFENYKSEGELQLYDEGISGIPVFQISSEILKKVRNNGKAEVTLDFLPDLTEDRLNEELIRAMESPVLKDFSPEEFLRGWLNKKLILPVMITAFKGNKTLKEIEKLTLSNLTERECYNLIKAVKAFPYTVVSGADSTFSQAFTGGLCTREIKDTFESKIVDNLFITGELLDITGKCGGYNLHFAWGSGIIAGRNALKGQ